MNIDYTIYDIPYNTVNDNLIVSIYTIYLTINVFFFFLHSKPCWIQYNKTRKPRENSSVFDHLFTQLCDTQCRRQFQIVSKSLPTTIRRSVLYVWIHNEKAMLVVVAFLTSLYGIATQDRKEYLEGKRLYCLHWNTQSFVNIYFVEMGDVSSTLYAQSICSYIKFNEPLCLDFKRRLPLRGCCHPEWNSFVFLENIGKRYFWNEIG